MNQWLYTVWFRDGDVSKDEEDYEWPACIVIETDAPKKAQEWGNKLSFDYCKSNKSLEFLKSTIEKFEIQQKIAEDLPIIKYGYLASDSEIGW